MTVIPHLLLQIVGFVAFFLSLVLAVVAGVYYIRNDVHAVKNNLLGRVQMIESVESGKRSVKRASDLLSTGSALDQTRIESRASEEDELETVLSADARRTSSGDTSLISYDESDINDEMPTLVNSKGDYHQTSNAKAVTDYGNSVIVETSEDGLPTEVSHANTDEEPLFQVTTSIHFVPSEEIIAVD